MFFSNLKEAFFEIFTHKTVTVYIALIRGFAQLPESTLFSFRCKNLEKPVTKIQNYSKKKLVYKIMIDRNGCNDLYSLSICAI